MTKLKTDLTNQSYRYNNRCFECDFRVDGEKDALIGVVVGEKERSYYMLKHCVYNFLYKISGQLVRYTLCWDALTGVIAQPINQLKSVVTIGQCTALFVVKHFEFVLTEIYMCRTVFTTNSDFCCFRVL
jgi:hypothetical protein